MGRHRAPRLPADIGGAPAQQDLIYPCRNGQRLGGLMPPWRWARRSETPVPLPPLRASSLQLLLPCPPPSCLLPNMVFRPFLRPSSTGWVSATPARRSVCLLSLMFLLFVCLSISLTVAPVPVRTPSLRISPYRRVCVHPSVFAPCLSPRKMLAGVMDGPLEKD